MRAASWARFDVPPLSTLALSWLASRAPGARPCSSSLALRAPPRRRSLRWRSSIWHPASGSGCPGACPARRVWPSWLRLTALCDCLGVREALWARRDVTPLSKLALSKLALSKLSSRAPGALEPVLLVKSGPPGHASPCTVTSSARDVRAASWARCYVLRSPRWRFSIWRLGLRVPRSPPCSSILALRATPRRALRLSRHVTCARPRGPAATSRRSPSWRSLQVVVSGSGCPGACPARQVWIAGPMVPDARSCGRSLLWASASLLWSCMLAPTDARSSRATSHAPRLPSVNWYGSPRLATSFLAAISLSQGLTWPVKARHAMGRAGVLSARIPLSLYCTMTYGVFLWYVNGLASSGRPARAGTTAAPALSPSWSRTCCNTLRQPLQRVAARDSAGRSPLRTARAAARLLLFCSRCQPAGLPCALLLLARQPASWTCFPLLLALPACRLALRPPSRVAWPAGPASAPGPLHGSGPSWSFGI